MFCIFSPLLLLYFAPFICLCCTVPQSTTVAEFLGVIRTKEFSLLSQSPLITDFPPPPPPLSKSGVKLVCVM